MLEIRPVTLNIIEWNEILNIRNLTSHGFGNTEQIDIDTHLNFMKDYYHDYVVAEMKGEIVGFGGVVKDDIRVAVHPDYQKLGIGKSIINYLSTRYPKAFAKVKIDNEASLKLFESCGFKKKWYVLEKTND
jgi:ribosomal protein S18 acetylase RimI-like enzyme